MRRVVLANETDWEGWRKATRSLVLAGVAPQDIRWSVRSHDEDGDPLLEATGSFSVPRALVQLASLAIQARDATRFELLYRLVLRANAGEQAGDNDMRRAQRLALAVRAEAHRMRTLLRFLPVEEAAGRRYLGWYQPAHYVLEANAQLITRRFPSLRLTILTPYGGAHWEGTELRFSTAWRPTPSRTTPRCNHGGPGTPASCCDSPAWEPPSPRRRTLINRLARPTVRRSARWCSSTMRTHRCKRRCTRHRTADAAICTSLRRRRCSARGRRMPRCFS